MNNTILTLIATAVAPMFFALAAKAQSETEDELKRLMNFPVSDIMKAKALVDKYTPEGQLYLVNDAGQDWLRRAISIPRRDEWLKQSDYWKSIGGETAARKKYLFDALDALKVSAEKKIPNYLPKDKFFAFHNEEEEKILKSVVSNLNEAEKIFNVGLAHENWVVENGSNGVPINRFKRGYIYFKFPKSISGHDFCQLLHVSIIQNYSGGGTFGSSFGKLVAREVCGCPK